VFIKTASILFITLFFTACSSSPKRSAPIVNILPSAVQSTANGVPGTYVVKPGENLYRIAFEHGLTYRDLAAWNNIADVNDIKVGQVLKLSGPDGVGSEANGVVVTGTNRVSSVSTKPLGTSTTVVTPTANTKNIVTMTDKPEVSSAAPTVTASSAEIGEDAIKMSWPAEGTMSASFAKNGKGIDINGKVGQAISAAADGGVVYSGAGLRGYGKMIILKHNKAYLTAYAHNNKLLVKEGDSVKKGQKIAEMGSTDADSVKLHFEVRRFGKPVDPTKYLTN
jgi:lipoprotein NlpD